MPLVNHVEPYVPGTIPFSQYLEQMEWIFIDNKMADPDEQKASFLAACGKEVYSELKLLFPGKDLKTVSFKEITDALKKRYDKTESDMIQRYKFYQRVQGSTESAEDFILAVKLQAEMCEFGEFKDIAIRDKLVCGIRDPDVQQRLFDEEGLTLAKAEKIIINRELAGANRKLVSRESGRVSVLNRLGKRQEPAVSRGGYRSRSRSRGASKRYRSRSPVSSNRGNRSSSRSRKFHCSFCGRDGHMRRFCYDLKNKEKKSVKFVDSLAEKPKMTEYQKSLRRRLNRSVSDDEDMECLMISSIGKINEPCFRSVLVKGIRLDMEIDCGAAVSVVSKDTYEGEFADIPMQKCTKKLAVINGSRLVVEGQIPVQVELNGRRKFVKLVVLRCGSSFTPLLGRDWLDIFFPEWRSAFGSSSNLNQLSLPMSEERVVDDIKGFEADLVLKKGASPIFKRAYDVPLRLKDKVVEHLDSLEKDGVITPIDASEWASPVIVVVKKDGGIRMVIDCKVSINKVIIPNTYPLPLTQDMFASLAGAKVFCSLDLAGAYTQLMLSKKSRKIMVINTIKDFFYFDKKVFLVIVDSFSKWLEVEYMKFGTDARKVISKFMSVFARFGLPDVVVTDGGPPFSSKEFIVFFEKHGVKVMKSPPYSD
ncbi:uncharacterized protein K02A2.6-like [Aedes albopictus]|uniref:Integrase catalytic domain-containing protein n=1 Tax=Aedes albopictus TaxID=7160 RepID=A0ABM2A1H1_AEDAL